MENMFTRVIRANGFLLIYLIKHVYLLTPMDRATLLHVNYACFPRSRNVGLT